MENKRINNENGLIEVYNKSPIGDRIIAFILDWIIYTIPILPGIIVIVLSVINNSYTGTRYGYDVPIGIIIGIILLLLGYIVRIVYSFIKDGIGNGQSYGKKVMGLMVIDLRSNTPINKGQSVLRRAVYVATLLVPIAGPFIEPIMVLINEKGKRLGDMASSTQVIKASEYRTDI